ncbi:hypothetical protein ACLESO_57760, partial [Pyxidicoccus sp. 3LG]
SASPVKGGGSSATASPVSSAQAQGKGPGTAASKGPVTPPGAKPAVAKPVRTMTTEAPAPRRVPPRGGGHGEGER